MLLFFVIFIIFQLIDIHTMYVGDDQFVVSMFYLIKGTYYSDW